MPPRSNRHRIPDDFYLSPDPQEPADMFQGLIPNMLRSGHSPHHAQLPSAESHSRRRNRRNEDLMLSMQSPFDHMSDVFGGSMMPFSSGFSQNMMQISTGMGSGGIYQSSFSVTTSVMDEHGKVKVERYKKAAYGNHDKDMHEITEAYSASDSKQDIMASERRAKNRGLQMIRRRDNNTNVIEETQQPIGLDESEVDDFNRSWYSEFNPHFPQLREANRPYRIKQTERKQLKQ